MSRMKHFILKSLLYLSIPASVLVVWQLLFYAGFIRPLTLPPPSQVAVSLWAMIQSGDLVRHIGISIVRVIEGFLLAVACGLVLGTAMGLSKTFAFMTDFIIQVLKPIPPIAWIPLAILWFGIEEESKVFIIFLGAFFPILVNTMDGIRQTDHRFVELARILEVGRSKFIFTVVLPGALPVIMTGIRVGLMVAWMCVVAAELIAASSGIGYLIMDARQLSQPDIVIVGMLSIGLIGKFMDSILQRVESRLVVWRVSFQGE